MRERCPTDPDKLGLPESVIVVPRPCGPPHTTLGVPRWSWPHRPNSPRRPSGSRSTLEAGRVINRDELSPNLEQGPSSTARGRGNWPSASRRSSHQAARRDIVAYVPKSIPLYRRPLGLGPAVATTSCFRRLLLELLATVVGIH